MCLHPSHVCDGILQCPEQDDEVLCQPSCPSHCLCQGLAWVCPTKTQQPLYLDIQGHPLTVLKQPRYLDAAHSGMTLVELLPLKLLVRLDLSHCRISSISWGDYNHTQEDFETRNNAIFPNLQHLDLSYNEILAIDFAEFLVLKNLKVLILSHNPIVSILNSASKSLFMITNLLSVKDSKLAENAEINLNDTNLQSFISSSILQTLDVSFTQFKNLNTSLLKDFPVLNILNISNSKITTISTEGFQGTPKLEHLIAKDTPIKDFPSDVLKSLVHLKSLTVENYKLCCPVYLPDNFDVNSCETTQDLLASCDDLLKSNYYRIFLWLFAALSLMGNITSFVARIYIDRSGFYKGILMSLNSEEFRLSILFHPPPLVFALFIST